MLIRDIFFLAIPKCACISMKQFCRSNNIVVIWHTRFFRRGGKIITTTMPIRNKQVFCVIRDPVERVVSAYCFLRMGGFNERDGRDWQSFCSDYIDINSFVKNGGLIKASKEQMHFLPQTYWVRKAKNPIILRFEHIQEDVNQLTQKLGLEKIEIEHRNASKREDAELNEESIEIIKQIYQQDVQLYLSNIDSRR